MENFVFFWNQHSPFSQWYPSPFQSVPLYNNSNSNNSNSNNSNNNSNMIIFSNCEQWMMYNKALLFNDSETAKKILKTTDLKKIKQLGRQVKNFKENIWDQHKCEIVYQGNHCKFTQHPDLLNLLLSTYGKTLVEASPYDTIWGIGLAEKDIRCKSRTTWRGLNLLGETLTRLCNDLQAEFSLTSSLDKSGV